MKDKLLLTNLDVEQQMLKPAINKLINKAMENSVTTEDIFGDDK